MDHFFQGDPPGFIICNFWKKMQSGVHKKRFLYFLTYCCLSNSNWCLICDYLYLWWLYCNCFICVALCATPCEAQFVPESMVLTIMEINKWSLKGPFCQILAGLDVIMCSSSSSSSMHGALQRTKHSTATYSKQLTI